MISEYVKLKSKYDTLMNYHIEMVRMNRQLIEENRELKRMLELDQMCLN